MDHEPFGIQPHHEIWGQQALGNPLPKHMNFESHATLFHAHVFQPLTPWHSSPYSTNPAETFLQHLSNNAIGTVLLDPFQHQHFPFVPHELFGVSTHLNPAANPRHSHRTQARMLLEQLHAAEFRSRRDSQLPPFGLEPQQHFCYPEARQQRLRSPEAHHLCKTFEPLNPSRSPEAWFHSQQQNPFQ